ncbi:MAG: hypothetical protein GF331_12350 [Chitinivibrionales bacterium]|nr:hypothetical protein [Chitinivibrionales bacterium]
MVTVKISNEEKDLLAEVLEGTVSDLRAEISHSDSPFYKEGLRRRKELLNDMIERVKQARDEG